MWGSLETAGGMSGGMGSGGVMVGANVADSWSAGGAGVAKFCVIYCHSKVFMVQATRLFNLICSLYAWGAQLDPAQMFQMNQQVQQVNNYGGGQPAGYGSYDTVSPYSAFYVRSNA